MTAQDLTTLAERYVSDLEDAGIPDPLAERLAVAAVLADLLTLAGAPLPPALAARLEEPAAVLAVG